MERGSQVPQEAPEKEMDEEGGPPHSCRLRLDSAAPLGSPGALQRMVWRGGRLGGGTLRNENAYLPCLLCQFWGWKRVPVVFTFTSLCGIQEPYQGRALKTDLAGV